MIRSPMLNLATAVVLSALVATSPATAQVYKVVAPDGHITYSDRPPIEVQTQATVIGAAGTHRLLNGPASAPAGPAKLYLPPAPTSAGAANRAIASAGHSRPSTDLQLIEALVAVRGYEALVKGYVDACGGMMPSSQGRFGAAAHAWRQNNAAVLKQTGDLGGNLFTAAQLDAIQKAGQARANDVLVPATAASKEARIKWCDEATDALNGTLLSLATKANINAGIDRYVAH